jgi:hypothetical protein
MNDGMMGMSLESSAVASCGCALMAAGAAAAGGWLARGSTAVPAAAWAAAAAISLAVEMAVRALGGLTDPATAAAVRLVTVALAVCPTMSLLGAKRPQHGVWQFIVGSLAVVLVMPALSATLVRPGTLPDVHMLERGFLAVLLLVGWMNFIGTRRAVAATLVTAGQAMLSRGFLPLVPATLADAQMPLGEAVAAAAIAAGAVLAASQSASAPRRSRSAGDETAIAARVARAYDAIRETLGAAWTLRIAERFNVVAEERGWPCRLHFRGLDVGGDPADTAWHRDAVRALRALLRRFVTDDWLDRHEWPVATTQVVPLKEGR